MKIKVKDLEITLMKTDVEVIPSIINNLTNESKMFILILASMIIPAYTYLKTHKNYIEVNDIKNNKMLNEEVIYNE